MASQAGMSAYTTYFDTIVGASVIASTIAFFNFAARIVATGAQDGMLPRMLGHIDPESHAPRPAIGLVGLVGALIPILIRMGGAANPIEAITTLSSIVLYFWLVPYFLMCIGAILILRAHGEGSARAIAIPAMGAIAIALVIAQSVFGTPGQWVKPAIAAGILMLALLFIRLFGRHVRSADALQATTQAPD